MDVGALFLLFGRVGGLKKEDGLGGQKDASGIEELAGRNTVSRRQVVGLRPGRSGIVQGEQKIA